MSRPVGHYITYFQNFDYLKKWYCKKHNTKRPADGHINQILSAIKQGEQYFKAASQADEIVSPLLLYYGVLSYVRGIILALDANKTEEQLKPSHGIQPANWKDVFSEKSKMSILDLGIKAHGGTFKECVDTVVHQEMFKVQTLNVHGVGYLNRPLGNVKFANDESVITLGDLVARLSATCDDYALMEGHEAQWCWTTATLLNSGEVAMDSASAHIPPWYSSRANEINLKRNETEPRCLIKGRMEEVDFPKVLLESSHYNTATSKVVSNFPNGDKLSEFLKLYLGAYILGMLVRYFPSQWMKMQSPYKGDFAMPLVYALIGSIERDFPREVERTLGLRDVSDDL
ncbi:YaaC-like Protein [Pseudovibrio denitrificans]|uniref:YaaC-like Protein n=1 Tax=Pseudovibrio denitrificans TaxID=258256 RepID=A0A1I7CIU7_9HYPH|nr:YaaC family protein [Pseudovibrio denitrificans]SFT99337.1 YaaC-like Protein [Pseudovibrio denitrificans]